LVDRVETDRPLVALTFDDGPTPEASDSILAVLREEGVRATFFFTGAELRPVAPRPLRPRGSRARESFLLAPAFPAPVSRVHPPGDRDHRFAHPCGGLWRRDPLPAALWKEADRPAAVSSS
jgi:hypothetical protein